MRARGEHLDRLVGGAADLAELRQRFDERPFDAVRRQHRRIRLGAEPLDDRADQFGAVARHNPEAVADPVRQGAGRVGEDDVPRVLLGAVAVEPAGHDEPRGEGLAGAGGCR